MILVLFKILRENITKHCSFPVIKQIIWKGIEKNAAEIITKQNYSCLLLQRLFNFFFVKNNKKSHPQVFYRTVVLMALVEIPGRHQLNTAALIEIGL